jgi:hypothetical protein
MNTLNLLHAREVVAQFSCFLIPQRGKKKKKKKRRRRRSEKHEIRRQKITS